MLNELKNKIKIKRQIITRSDCQFLSDKIIEEGSVALIKKSLFYPNSYKTKSHKLLKSCELTIEAKECLQSVVELGDEKMSITSIERNIGRWLSDSSLFVKISHGLYRKLY